MVSKAQVDWVMCYGMMECCVLEGRMLGKSARERRPVKLVDDLLEKKNYADLKKAAEDRSIWRTIRGCERITNEEEDEEDL